MQKCNAPVTLALRGDSSPEPSTERPHKARRRPPHRVLCPHPAASKPEGAQGSGVAGGQCRPRAAGSEAPVTSARSTCPPRPRCSPGCTCGLAAAGGKAGHWGVSRPVPRPAPRPLAPRILPVGALQAQTYPSASVTGRRVAGGAQGRRGSHSCGVAEGMPQPVSPPPASPGVPCPKSGAGGRGAGHTQWQTGHFPQPGGLPGQGPQAGRSRSWRGPCSEAQGSCVRQGTFQHGLCQGRSETKHCFLSHTLQQPWPNSRPVHTTRTAAATL